MQKRFFLRTERYIGDSNTIIYRYGALRNRQSRLFEHINDKMIDLYIMHYYIILSQCYSIERQVQYVLGKCIVYIHCDDI